MELMFANAVKFHASQREVVKFIKKLHHHFRKAYQEMIDCLKKGEKIMYPRVENKGTRKGRSWERGDRKIDREKIIKLVDLLNQLSIHKKHELLKLFNKKYPDIRPEHGGFDIQNLDLEKGLFLIKLASKLEPEELDLERLLGLQRDSQAHERSHLPVP